MAARILLPKETQLVCLLDAAPVGGVLVEITAGSSSGGSHIIVGPSHNDGTIEVNRKMLSKVFLHQDPTFFKNWSSEFSSNRRPPQPPYEMVFCPLSRAAVISNLSENLLNTSNEGSGADIKGQVRVMLSPEAHIELKKLRQSLAMYVAKEPNMLSGLYPAQEPLTAASELNVEVKKDDEVVRTKAEMLGVSLSEARFIVAMETGKIMGDTTRAKSRGVHFVCQSAVL